MMRIVIIFFLSYFLFSCRNETSYSKPKFLPLIKNEIEKDSNLLTVIRLIPKEEYIFLENENDSTIHKFLIVNKGEITFKPTFIDSNCDCIELLTPIDEIQSKDSVYIFYKLAKKIKHNTQQSIIVVGNCQYGNQTFVVYIN